MRSNGVEEACRAKFLTTVNHGDLLRVRLAGGGGHGNPLLRDKAAVLEDVIEEKMSIEHAKLAYGVVIFTNPLAVDEAATALLRLH
jgi:N-methylhydantoinase B